MGNGALERRRRRVDGGDVRGAARQRRDAEAPGVAVAVQYLREAEPAHRVGEVAAVVALVEVEAGLVAAGDVDDEAPVVLVDGRFRRRAGGVDGRAAAQPAAGRLEALALPRRGVAALVESRRAARLQQGIGDRPLPALGAGRQELRREHVGVAVDDEPGQAVGLAVDEANAVAGDRQPAADVDRRRDAAGEEGGVDALGLVEAPGAQADERLRAVGRPGEEAPVARLDTHRLARVGLAAVDAALEHPRVTAQQRALLSGAQADGLQGFLRRARGCAASYTFERWPKSSLV